MQHYGSNHVKIYQNVWDTSVLRKFAKVCGSYGSYGSFLNTFEIDSNYLNSSRN